MMNFFKKNKKTDKPLESDDESTQSEGLVKKTWGTVRTVHEDVTGHFEFRKIVINPKSQTSLHRHLQRREYWYIAHGGGIVETTANPGLYKETHTISKGQEIVINQGKWHRIVNNSETQKLIIYEVAIGDISENDVERHVD